ncbi:hypothetical protein M409DRAFT_22209 [Zasmidium cellare ATCC 36951]|uniref:Phosphatidylglycerol/phosphatidylinositol transfer protein n=1 Tax=Zasmidium cellare ATCC 36951 TaxID=1080233 RepID=A0A6A6CMF8_ZASCE|nr:uncharacterized protein M409DRAFT_22209 [Zasmidium cellare ATCC 36951]KAF2167398.1 hypothetical protein M409DRAFT_22209 [Zasmidium cellare ATCC 36951]
MLLSLFPLISTLLTATTATPSPIAQSPLASSQGRFSWTDLGLPEDILQISKLTIDPDALETGTNYTITHTGTLSADLEEGATVDLTIKLGLIKLLATTIDLCDNEYLKLECPVAKGEVSWTTESAMLPREVPKAKFKIQAVGLTAEDEDLFSVEAEVDFRG